MLLQALCSEQLKKGQSNVVLGPRGYLRALNSSVFCILMQDYCVSIDQDQGTVSVSLIFNEEVFFLLCFHILSLF